MMKNSICIISEREKIEIPIKEIMYCISEGKIIEIHRISGNIIRTRTTISELEEMLGFGFIKIHRGCLVAAKAIHDIGSSIHLLNGETLSYTIRKKKQIRQEFSNCVSEIFSSHTCDDTPSDYEGYCEYYRGMENMPFAFTDIEMVFDSESHAIDWIFRYGNEALSKLEKISLDNLIGKRFGHLFKNMDKKWLIAYGRSARLGETLEFTDYSPEIGTYIKVICFPTFYMHCGCIMFNISDITFTELSVTSRQSLKLYAKKRKTLYK